MGNICPLCAALNLPFSVSCIVCILWYFFPSSCVVFCTLEDPGCQNSTRPLNPNSPGYRVDPDDSSCIALLTFPSLPCENIHGHNVLVIVNCILCFSAGKPTCECDRGAKWDWGVNDVGGTSRKAQWGTAGLHGGVQHPCCTAGESGTITRQSRIHQTNASFHTDNCGFFCGQFYVDTGLDTELSINLSAPLSNVSFRVCAYTGAGKGPWTHSQTLTLVNPGEWCICHVNSADKDDCTHYLD